MGQEEKMCRVGHEVGKFKKQLSTVFVANLIKRDLMLDIHLPNHDAEDMGRIEAISCRKCWSMSPSLHTC